MKNHKYLTFCTFYLTCWCHVTSAFETVDEISAPLEIDLLVPEAGDPDHTHLEQRSAKSDLDNEEEEYALAYDTDPEPLPRKHSIRKRQTEPKYYTPAYCKTLGFCSLMPTLSAVCLMKCNFNHVPLFQPFLGLLPELPMYLCQSVNTILPSLSKLLYMRVFSIETLKMFFKLVNIKLEDQTDFAKTAANALPVTMIKSIRGIIFDQLKPAIKKLEIHDTDKKAKKNMPNSFKKFSSSPFSLAMGGFVNQKCDKTNFEDEALLLISAMKVCTCAKDILMPGYFVFNPAPKVAKTSRILPQLKAWNMPLIMFTGVRCCMVEYAVSKNRKKCAYKYDILNMPHGLPSQNGPDTVCNSIPEFSPMIIKTITSPPLKGRNDGPEAEMEETTTTTESPCNDENRSELEECATENALLDYSNEATTETQPEESTTTEDYATIESDEIIY